MKMRSKKTIVLILMTFLLLFWVPGFALDHIYPAQVERIIDGDTIVVGLQLGLGVVLADQYISLYGIDAWEITGENKEKGLKAKEYLEERLKEGNIEIEIRPEWGQNGKGSFGRWLGIVYVDGVNVNIELVEKGHAEKYEEGGN